MTPRAITVLLATLASAAGTLAQTHETDVVVRVESGRIVTGRIENGTAVLPRFVIGSTLGSTGIPNAITDPGFDSTAGTFTPGQIIGFTVRRALRKWNGSDFSNIPAERMRLTKGAAQNILTPATDLTACVGGPGIILGQSNTAGRIHEHPGYELLSPASDGVYALEIELWLGSAGLGRSAPMWILFNQNADPAAYDAAFAWADVNLPAQAGNLCPGNCDGSTTAPVLNALDFSCFLSRYRAGDCYANCDGSTTAPVLNALDFSCFLTQYRAGCP